jgi:hypothetical protein
MKSGKGMRERGDWEINVTVGVWDAEEMGIFGVWGYYIILCSF